jgi:tRNA pseudouridine32 synthase/23S rRNA pseudouridine746 synthase
MSWIVHVDASLVVVNKPAGLLSVPGRGPDKQDCAWHRVRADWPDARVVHRLDMATSGLLLFARGAQAQRTSSSAFANRQVHKRYVAIVCGEPPGESGEIGLPLAPDWPNRPRQQVDWVRGRPSLTRWRVLAREARGCTRIEFEPVTGRSHQLRVHAAAMGWPIAGDPLYGPVHPQTQAPLPDGRLMLHASELALPHPDTGEVLVICSGAPF